MGCNANLGDGPTGWMQEMLVGMVGQIVLRHWHMKTRYRGTGAALVGGESDEITVIDVTTAQ